LSKVEDLGYIYVILATNAYSSTSMKRFVSTSIILSLFTSVTKAQTPDQLLRKSVKIAVAMAPLYKSTNDTTHNITYLTRGNEVQVLNVDDPYWVIVRRGDENFFTGKPNLGIKDALPVGPPPVSMEMIQAVPKDPTTGAIDYTAVVPAEGLSQNDLYLRAKTWIINVFSSPKDVIKTEEKDVGIIICKGFTEEVITYFGRASPVKLYFTIKIAVKDGRYKYDITDFFIQNYPSEQTPNPEKIPAHLSLAAAFGKNGRPAPLPQLHSLIIITKAKLIEANVRKALSKGEDW
jgi:hypothetical protein